MIINRKIGDYVLLRRLAVGGQSEVFLAMKMGPREFTRPVVIKALPSRYRRDPKFVELFYREAFISARFSHPNCIEVHDAKLLRGDHCMVMDFISGQTVADIAQRGYQQGDPLTVNQAVQIIADACDGLHYAHKFRDLDDTEYTVIHRDVSPQNLMVTYHGVTKVFDFGIAKIMEAEDEEEADTLAGGKYAYMSPEQCRDEPVDERSDIFSLGIILYELTTGFRLFRRSSKSDVIEAVTEDEIKSPADLKPEFPRFLEGVIMKALERDPDRRYQTAALMRDDLLQYLDMHSDGKERHDLGDYVAELFEDERENIAAALQYAKEHEIDPTPLEKTPLEKIGIDGVDESAEELEVPMPEPVEDDELREPLEEEGEEANDAEEDAEEEANSEDFVRASSGETTREIPVALKRKAKRLAGEVDRLQQRQNLLIALLCLLALIAAGLGWYNYTISVEKAGQSEPIELGSPEG